MFILNILGFILKLILTFVLWLILIFMLIIGGMVVRKAIVYHNYYAKTLQVAIPQRKADFREDTHGGFHGDGDTVEIYELTDKEIKTLSEDVKTNSRWKSIDDDLYSSVLYLNGKYCAGKVPKLENCWYCFYDKQTKTFEFPAEDVFSYNYIICQYSEEEGKLWIYGLDT